VAAVQSAVAKIAPVGAQPARPNGDASRARVLIVDDEDLILNFLRTGLRYEGFEVAEAHSGEEALSLAAQFKPDIVVLDLMLPGTDGYEVCRRLRGDPEIGILMLTRQGRGGRPHPGPRHGRRRLPGQAI